MRGVGSFEGAGQPHGSAMSPAMYMAVMAQLWRMEEEQALGTDGMIDPDAAPMEGRAMRATELNEEQVTFDWWAWMAIVFNNIFLITRESFMITIPSTRIMEKEECRGQCIVKAVVWSSQLYRQDRKYMKVRPLPLQSLIF